MPKSREELLARNLKKIRTGLGRPQAEIARDIGYSPAALCLKENNSRPLYAADLQPIAKALGLDFLVFVSMLYSEETLSL